jgi:hypothetical protein
VCRSWGPAARRTGSTRSKGAPDGGTDGRPLLEREVLGNLDCKKVVELCLCLVQVGGWFYIENPQSSDLWRAKRMCYLCAHASCFSTDVDQCLYDLSLPGAPPNTFCRKRTRFLSNDSKMRRLACRCIGQSNSHKHEHAWGTRKVGTVTHKLTQSAGTYPPKLCAALAAVIHERLR